MPVCKPAERIASQGIHQTTFMADDSIDPLHSEDITSDVCASATSSSQVSERALEKCIDNIFSKYICPLCKRFLENPAQLPCDHSYCMSCIEWLLRNIPDPECLICGKKIVTDDAIFNFGSIKPDQVKRKEMNSLKMQGFQEEFFSAEPLNPSEEDPLLMSQNRQEHPFPKHFVSHPLALWFQHPDGDADIGHSLSRIQSNSHLKLMGDFPSPSMEIGPGPGSLTRKS